MRAWTLDAGEQRGVAVSLPAHLPVPDREMQYRLRAQVAVPAEWIDKDLELVIPELYARVQLRVDGQPAQLLAGGTSASYRPTGPHRWVIAHSPATTRELELVIDHAWTQSGWLLTTPRLVLAGESDALTSAVEIFNLSLTIAGLVALLQIGITSLGVYLVDRRRLPYLWFAVQALTASFYPLFVTGYAARLFGVYDVALLAIMLQIAVTASVEFTHGYFGLPRASRRWWIACGVTCAISLACSGPFVATAVAGPLTVGFITITIAYQLWVCSGLVRRHAERASAIVLLGAWLSLGLTSFPDLVLWTQGPDVLGGVRLASVGLGVFAGWLSLLLSRRHITSLNRADDLNVELAARVDQLVKRGAEIEQLNEELRRQIGDRSQQIYAALALSQQKRGQSPEPAPGDVVQGRYRIERPIGAGGMGTVYAVTRLVDGKPLALKMARELSGVALARLAREAQIASTMSHPNLVGVIDVDVATSGFLYIVMELVEGTTLKDQRAQFGKAAWALPLLTQLASGITALHEAGVVHRDLKPGNVLVTYSTDDGLLIKIADFGISLQAATADDENTNVFAGAAGDQTDVDDGEVHEARTAVIGPRAAQRKAVKKQASSFLTATGMVPGTPAYIAPEVVGGREQITAAADMFAFGVIAFEMLTGKRPFVEPPAVALLQNRPAARAPSILHTWPDAIPEVAALVDACLSHDPKQRPTAAEVASALTTLIRG